MHKWPILVLLIGFSLVSHGAVDIRQQYAYGYDIKTDHSGPVISTHLNATVYEGVFYPDLKDITVINAEGQEVPFTIQQQSTTQESQLTLFKLPYYPLTVNVSDDVNAVRVHTHADGTIINIGNHQVQAGKNTRLFYIIDATQIEQGSINRIQIEWQKHDETQLIEARLEGSNDLQNWQTLANLVFSKMSFAGYELLKDSADLNSKPQKYYRLSWSPGEESPIQQVRLYVDQTRIHLPKDEIRILEAESTENNSYYFDSHAFLPITQVNVLPATDNSIAEVRIASRNEPQADWKIHGTMTIYRLHIGDKRVENNPLHLDTRAARFWKVDVIGEKNYLNAAPALQLTWQAQQLLFMAQGKAPYQLLFGRSHQERQQSEQLVKEMIQLTQKLDADSIEQGSLVNHKTLCGSDCLKPVVLKIDWTRYILWLVIVVAVGGLAWMSRVLFREMNKTPQ